eukprot:204091-Pyramimonas_sp.AAC.2
MSEAFGFVRVARVGSLSRGVIALAAMSSFTRPPSSLLPLDGCPPSLPAPLCPAPVVRGVRRRVRRIWRNELKQ